mmetsp:Transcript_122752/g.347024  ORF Transcript_122752/g.347024 Transcript_122752/m.347024 type:complete len:228 (-) Transcript_122752:743-1426(-)
MAPLPACESRVVDWSHAVREPLHAAEQGPGSPHHRHRHGAHRLLFGVLVASNVEALKTRLRPNACRVSDGLRLRCLIDLPAAKPLVDVLIEVPAAGRQVPHQERGHLVGAARDSDLRGRLRLLAALNPRVCPSLQKAPCAFNEALLGGNMQRRVTRRVPRVDLPVGLEKEPHSSSVAISARPVQRRCAQRISRSRGRLALQQVLHHGLRASSTSVMKRGAAAGVHGA